MVIFDPLAGADFSFVANTSFSFSFIPSAVAISGTLQIVVQVNYNNSGSIEAVSLFDQAPTGHFIFGVQASGISPTSYGFRLAFPVRSIAILPLNWA